MSGETASQSNRKQKMKMFTSKTQEYRNESILGGLNLYISMHHMQIADISHSSVKMTRGFAAFVCVFPMCTLLVFLQAFEENLVLTYLFMETMAL